MKQKLEKKLEQDERNLTWFWKKYIKGVLSYPAFYNQLNGTSPLRDDIKRIITGFLND